MRVNREYIARELRCGGFAERQVEANVELKQYQRRQLGKYIYQAKIAQST